MLKSDELHRRQGTTLTREHGTRLVIVGGGFAGCLLAGMLRDRNRNPQLCSSELGSFGNFILLEKEETLGGRMPLMLTPRNTQIFEGLPKEEGEAQLAFSFPARADVPTGGEHFSDRHKKIFEELGLKIVTGPSATKDSEISPKNGAINGRKNGSDTLIFLMTNEGSKFNLSKLKPDKVKELRDELIKSTLVLENSCSVPELDPTWAQEQLHHEIRIGDDGKIVFLNGHESYSFLNHPISHTALALEEHEAVWLNTTVTKVRYTGQLYQISCEVKKWARGGNQYVAEQKQLVSDALVFALPPWQLLGLEIESDDQSFPVDAIKTLAQIRARPLVFKFLVSGVFEQTEFSSPNIKEVKVLCRSKVTQEFYQFVLWPRCGDLDVIATGALTLIDPTNQALKSEMIRSVLAFLHKIGIRKPRLTLITAPDLSGGSYPIYTPSVLPDDVLLQCLEDLAEFKCFFVGDAYEPKNFGHMAAAAGSVNQVFQKLVSKALV
jgi:hypothetical protein